MPRPLRRLLAAALLTALALPACAGDRVQVLYAGSLVHMMERQIGPAFEQASGYRFEGYSAGSMALAKQIKGRLRRADVFVSASPGVNEELMGAANGGWIRWYAQFAQSPLLIGYNPASKYANAIQHQRWDKALTAPGIRIGRTDPRLDPKGKYTVELLEQAQQVYHDPGLRQRMLGDADNPQQVLPEETLIGRLQSGQLDAGFFYSTETADLKIPAVKLPPPFAQKARYTVTIVANGPDPEGAEAFVAFLLGPHGRQIMRESGLELVEPATLSGDPATVPASLKPLVGATP